MKTETKTGSTAMKDEMAAWKNGEPGRLNARGMSIPQSEAAPGRDSILVDETRGIFIVSDALPVHSRSDVAEEMAVRLLPGMLEEEMTGAASAGDVHSAMTSAAARMNERVLDKMVHEKELRGMGASIVMAVVKKGAAHILHLGGCRAYLASAGRLHRITRDHTLHNLLEERTPGAPHELENPGYITRFLGKRFRRPPVVKMLPLAPGDLLLLTSPGLHDTIGDTMLLEKVRIAATPGQVCDALSTAMAESAPGTPASAIAIGFSIH